jgi:hypothetical protein
MPDDPRQRQIAELIEKIKNAPDRVTAFNLLLDAIIQLSGAERGFIAVKNPQTGALEFQIKKGISQDQPDETQKIILDAVFNSQQRILTNNAQYDARFQQGEAIVGYALRSIMAFPIQEGDEVVGVAYVDNRLVQGLFRPDDLDLIQALVDQKAPALAPPEPDAIELEDFLTVDRARPEEQAKSAETLPPPPQAPSTPQKPGYLYYRREESEEKPAAPSQPPPAPPIPAPIAEEEIEPLFDFDDDGTEILDNPDWLFEAEKQPQAAPEPIVDEEEADYFGGQGEAEEVDQPAPIFRGIPPELLNPDSEKKAEAPPSDVKPQPTAPASMTDDEVRAALEAGQDVPSSVMEDFLSRKIDKPYRLSETDEEAPAETPKPVPSQPPEELVDDGLFIGGGQQPKPSQAPASPGGSATITPDTPSTIQFSAYYPREVLPMEWNPLTAYIFRAEAADQIAEDAHRQLGPRVADMRRVSQPTRAPINDGALMTCTPYLDGFQFNPPSITIGFFEAWHRLDFKLRALPQVVNRASNGFLTFTSSGLIVADIPLSVFVTESAAQTVTPTPAAKAYEAVFISYSRKDEPVVKRAETLYRLIGADYMRDLLSLKAGEKWDEKLLEFIDRADIFQLFWSQTASQSEAVEKEWRHALRLSMQRPAFIRPVYWQQPIPNVPPELSHINFAYIPELGT